LKKKELRLFFGRKDEGRSPLDSGFPWTEERSKMREDREGELKTEPNPAYLRKKSENVLVQR